MNQKDNIKLNAISMLDDEIIDKNTEKRCLLLRKSAAKRVKQIWTYTLSLAACVAILISGISILLYRQTIPVYQGMTVSNSAPVSTTVMTENYTVGSLKNDAFPTSEKISSLTEKTNEKSDKETLSFDTDTYYARPNQDIYITVHIDNPSEYEILSFTLNGVKYSSYMFEEGSDLENLILKVNVGEHNGVHEFTIDQIKYVNDEEIRNVIMSGNDTVRVIVTPKALVGSEGMHMRIRYDQMQTFLGIEEFTALSLYENGNKLYDIEKGEELIKGLPFDHSYELVGRYKKGGRTKTFSYPFVSLQSSQGLLIVNGKIAGLGTCTDNVLYLNMPVADSAFAESKNITEVYMGEGVTSIGDFAFYNCRSLSHVSLPNVITEIGTGSFNSCSLLTEIELPHGVRSIGALAFLAIHDLTIVLPSTVTEIKEFSFANCQNLTIRYNGTKAQWKEIVKDSYWFRNDSGNTSIQGTVNCTDGVISIFG